MFYCGVCFKSSRETGRLKVVKTDRGKSKTRICKRICKKCIKLKEFVDFHSS